MPEMPGKKNGKNKNHDQKPMWSWNKNETSKNFRERSNPSNSTWSVQTRVLIWLFMVVKQMVVVHGGESHGSNKKNQECEGT